MNSVTIADIFRVGFAPYAAKHGPFPAQHYAVANAIMACRTERLGGHVYRCNACGYEVQRYNSCRNRHCPACQRYASAKWVQERIDELLPVQYFHVVFTIPSQLNPFALRNKRAFYRIMFRAVSETLQELGHNPRRLGGTTGFTAILHTWGQNVVDHPHIHCVVPGGVLKKRTGRWKHCRRKFLLPVAVLRKLFRGKFLAYFKQAVANGDIRFHGRLQQSGGQFASLLRQLYQTNWIVYAKPPFAGPQAVIKYLGRYTHRIAISNQRIIALRNGTVTFRWKDYADANRDKTMTLPVGEFIRRFMLHVVPKGFMRIRHFGFLSSRGRKTLLPLCRKALGMKQKIEGSKPPRRWFEIIKLLCGTDPRVCSACGSGMLEMLRRIAKAPPGLEALALRS